MNIGKENLFWYMLKLIKKLLFDWINVKKNASQSQQWIYDYLQSRWAAVVVDQFVYLFN